MAENSGICWSGYFGSYLFVVIGHFIRNACMHGLVGYLTVTIFFMFVTWQKLNFLFLCMAERGGHFSGSRIKGEGQSVDSIVCNILSMVKKKWRFKEEMLVDYFSYSHLFPTRKNRVQVQH